NLGLLLCGFFLLAVEKPAAQIPNPFHFFIIMKKSLLFFSVLVVSITFSCSSKRDTGSMNMENWKSDRNGCKGLRIQDLEELERLKHSYLGVDNQALIKTFGRPDRVELVDKS